MLRIRSNDLDLHLVKYKIGLSVAMGGTNGVYNLRREKNYCIVKYCECIILHPATPLKNEQENKVKIWLKLNFFLEMPKIKSFN